MSELFLSVLVKAIQGWLGVFVVTLVIILVIMLLNRLTSHREK